MIGRECAGGCGTSTGRTTRTMPVTNGGAVVQETSTFTASLVVYRWPVVLEGKKGEIGRPLPGALYYCRRCWPGNDYQGGA